MPTATKLEPAKLLSRLASSNGSGCLGLDTELVSWKIYLQQGSLQYVYCSAELLDQLKYHLHYCGWKQAIAALKLLPSSFIKPQPSATQNRSPAQSIYGKIVSWLLEEEHLNLSQASKLIESITKDELQSCLWLDLCNASWHEEEDAPAWIPSQIKNSLSFEIEECLNDGQIKLRQWQKCSEELRSVYQRPYFPPSWETKTLPASGSLSHQNLTELTKVLKGGTSIRQLSTLLRKDEIQVAQILSPYIDEKIIYLHHAQAPLDQLPCIPRNIFQAPIESSQNSDENDTTQGRSVKKTTKTQKIVCIDDSPTILSEIQRFLDRESFEITAIDDPVRAVSKIFTINPDLILLDITMPRINGYKLCGLLRSSGKCDETPIIMVTGNTGLIDKARAKLSGATDYFTKPFTKDGLNTIVAKYLP